MEENILLGIIALCALVLCTLVLCLGMFVYFIGLLDEYFPDEPEDEITTLSDEEFIAFCREHKPDHTYTPTEQRYADVARKLMS